MNHDDMIFKIYTVHKHESQHEDTAAAAAADDDDDDDDDEFEHEQHPMIPGSWFATKCPKSLLKGQLLSAQPCACRAETERAAWGEGEFGLQMAWVGACLSKNFGIKWEDGSMEEDEHDEPRFFFLRWHLSWGDNLGQKEWTWNEDKKDHLGDVVWW